MRALLIILLPCTIWAGVALAAMSEREIDEFSGPVKSVRFETQEVDEDTGKLDTERTPGSEDWYDRAGNLIEEKYHTTDFIDDRHPQRIDTQTYLFKSTMGDKRRHRTFDSSGKVIEETVATIGPTPEVINWTRFKYDAHGRQIESDDISDGKVIGFTLTTRDAHGNEVRDEFHLNGNHAPFPRTWYEEYKLDRHGNWIERDVYDFDPENGKPKRTFTGIDYRVIEYYDDSKSNGK